MSLITRTSEAVIDGEGDLAAAALPGTALLVEADETAVALDGTTQAVPSVALLEVALNPDLGEDDEIPADERVDVAYLQNGVEAYGRAGEAIAENDLLGVDDAGQLATFDDEVHTAAVGVALGEAEAADELVNVRWF